MRLPDITPGHNHSVCACESPQVGTILFTLRVSVLQSSLQSHLDRSCSLSLLMVICLLASAVALASPLIWMLPKPPLPRPGWAVSGEGRKGKEERECQRHEGRGLGSCRREGAAVGAAWESLSYLCCECGLSLRRTQRLSGSCCRKMSWGGEVCGCGAYVHSQNLQ